MPKMTIFPGEKRLYTDRICEGKREDEAFYGFIRCDNSRRRELPFPQDSNHFHSKRPWDEISPPLRIA